MRNSGAILVLALVVALSAQCFPACVFTAAAKPAPAHCHEKTSPPASCSHSLLLADEAAASAPVVFLQQALADVATFDPVSDIRSSDRPATLVGSPPGESNVPFLTVRRI